MLKTHYRQPLDWTLDRLIDSSVELGTIKNTVRMANPDRGKVLPDVISALCDDLNTHLALQALMRKGNKPDDLANTLVWLGLFDEFEFEIGKSNDAERSQTIEKAFQQVEEKALASIGMERIRLDQLIAARLAARKAKNWAEADRIRDELAAMGVVLKDSKDGTTWEIAR
jgi:cysteinyl-tRNA synthetase